MSNLPKLRSREQIIGDIVDGLLARTDGINDLKDHSVLAQLIESIGQSQFKATADVIAMISAMSIDRAKGEALQRLAADRNVPIVSATPASDFVDITDLTFPKIETTIFAGQPAPVAGSLIVYVIDKEGLPETGRVYIGRGTEQSEGPLTYTSITSEGGGSYFAINLSPTTPTTKFHNVGEKILLAQGGDRLIKTGAIVQTPQSSTQNSITYRITTDTTILDGEVTVSNVPIECNQAGPIGNVPKGAISEAIGLGFEASVFNPRPLTNGLPTDTEDDIRARIKAYEQTKSKGTEDSIKSASIGVMSQEEQKKVYSSSVVRYADNSSALVFDDGAGYEAKVSGVGVEQVIDEAIGGEKELQLRQHPLAQSRVESVGIAPFDIREGMALSVEIAGVPKTHYFGNDFRVPGKAATYEITASINGNPNIHFYATTSENQSKIVLYPRDTNLNDIKVNAFETDPSLDSNSAFQFPLTKVYTIRLYRGNGEAIYQDGALARVTSRPKFEWSSSIVDGDTLAYKVDKTKELSVTITLDDFQSVEDTALPNSSTSIDVWAEVLTNLMSGVTVGVNGEILTFTSNLGYNNKAKIEITGGTLKDKIFEIGAIIYSEGRSSDYKLNRETGQVALSEKMKPGEYLAAGSNLTRAKIYTNDVSTGIGATCKFYLTVDGSTKIKPTGLLSSSLIQMDKTGTKLRITGRNSADTIDQGFENAKVGDWLVIWTETSDNPLTLGKAAGVWKIEAVDGSTLTVDDGDMNRSGALGVSLNFAPNRIVLTETLSPIQRIDLVPDTNIDSIISSIKSQIDGAVVDIEGGRIRVSTASFKDSGQIVILAADAASKAIGIEAGTISNSIASHVGSVMTSQVINKIPSFSHGTITNSDSADWAVISTTQVIEDSQFSENFGNENLYYEFLNRYFYHSPEVPLMSDALDSNKGRKILIKNTDGSDITIGAKKYIYNSPVQTGDRYVFKRGMQFDETDSLSVILDGDTSTKTYVLPVARKMVVSNHSTPTTSDFSASDGESSLEIKSSFSFDTFDFSDFKVLRRAHTMLGDGTYSLRVSAYDFGKKGESIRVGIAYPKTINDTEISHSIEAGEDSEIKIHLPVVESRNGIWDSSTSFISSVTVIGGKERITFEYKVGTQPDFSAAGANVNVGDLCFITENTSFLAQNKGIVAKIVNVTSTSFTVERPIAGAVSDALVASNISNDNGVITVTTSTPHNVKNGDRVGLYDTGFVVGSTAPMDGSYTATVISANQFSVVAGGDVPSDLISSASFADNLVTVDAPDHGLEVGNFIKISGVSASAYNGSAVVFSVLSPDSFVALKGGSAPNVSGSGYFDFQSIGTSGISYPITSASRISSGLMTVVSPHSLVVGDKINISGTTVIPWQAGTPYDVGHVVEYAGGIYRAIAGIVYNQNRIPSDHPEFWSDEGSIGDAPIWDQAIPNYYHDIVQYSGNGHYYMQIQATPTIGPQYNPSTQPASWVQLGSWSGAVQYVFGPHGYPGVIYNSRFYIAIEQTIQNTDLVPPSQPLLWELYENKMEGNFIVEAIRSGEFDVYTADIGQSSSLTGGIVSKLTPKAKIARSIADNSNLSFASAWATTNEINDYIKQSLSNTLISSIVSGSLASIGKSTYDNDQLTNYLSGAIEEYSTVKNSNDISLTISGNVVAGSVMSISGVGAYNGIYVVQECRQIPSTTKYSAKIRTNIIGSTTVSTVISGTYYGYHGTSRLANSENSILASNLHSGAGIPQFVLKKPWGTSMSVNEEIRIMAVTQDHLVRFWNKLIVSGISNQCDILLSGEEIQFSTKLFGSKGSVRVAGGYANSGNIAIIESGTIHGSTGKVTIPYELRKSINNGDWVRIAQTVRKNKELNLNNLTQMKTFISGGIGGIEINGTANGKFQTKRTVGTMSTIKVERHGDFMAFINTGAGTIFSSVQEGDWVKVSGAFNSNNSGVFQVVRTFEGNTFWIVVGNMVEEHVTVSSQNDLSFYSYDSVMPGDTLMIGSDILGFDNIGRYKVLDEDVSLGSQFPSETKIYTEKPVSASSYVLLGDYFLTVNVEEMEPINIYKKIYKIGPSVLGYASVIFDTPNLVDKLSDSLGCYIEMQGKLGFNTQTNFGLDAYKYYTGLMKELNNVIYGNPSNPLLYPGYRAAGTSIIIQPSLKKRVVISLAVRVRTGIPFIDIRDRVKATVAGYINALKVGQPVSLAEVVANANSVPGIVSTVITYPTYGAGNDIIKVNPEEKAIVVNPLTDISVDAILN